jgi:Uma2 family endonuclease
MSLPQGKVKYTPEQYLELERASEVRHEYLDGVIYEMSGESLAHSRICVNLAGEVRARLRGTDCEALSPNMKVRAVTKGLFAYPDLTVVCGEPIFHDQKKDVLLNPRVIFEVQSPSTERYDRTEKLMRYRNAVDSLTDYVLVAQDRPFVEHLEKQADGNWVHTAYELLDSTMTIPSVGCELPLAEIYDRVEVVEDPEARAESQAISSEVSDMRGLEG